MESRPKRVTAGTLCVLFLVAIRALSGCWLTLARFHGVAIDTQATLGCRVVESGLQLGLHRGCRRFGVAVGTSFLRCLGGLLGLGGVVAGFALHGRMRFVVELDAAHRSALQDHWTCRSLLRQGIGAHQKNAKAKY